MASVRATPGRNIEAGIGYLLMRMASFEHRTVQGADFKVYDIVVKPGDSLDRIARTQGSTIDILRKLNPTAVVLRPGQSLKYQKASIQRVVTGWRSISTASIALRYNAGGDENYAKKLDHAFTLMQQGKAAACDK